MNNTVFHLPESIKQFISARQARGGVSAVLIYGSYARGTQHEKSDVDLIFIVDEGFKSEYILHEGIDIEVLESTLSDMISYWQQNWDEDRHWYLWKDARVLYDRDGDGAKAVAHALSLVGDRQSWSQEHTEARKHIMKAKLGRCQYLAQKDPTTAAMLLTEFVRTLIENWFIVRGKFVPSTKEFLTCFSKQSPEFEQLLRDFYSDSTNLNARFALLERMIERVYG